jgi:hypothetical protein
MRIRKYTINWRLREVKQVEELLPQEEQLQEEPGRN